MSAKFASRTDPGSIPSTARSLVLHRYERWRQIDPKKAWEVVTTVIQALGGLNIQKKVTDGKLARAAAISDGILSRVNPNWCYL